MAYEKSLQGIAGEDTAACPECSSTEIARRDYELFCLKCGYVIE